MSATIRPLVGSGVAAKRILVWHVHGSYTTSLLQGRHTYYIPVLPDRGADGRGRARTWTWPENAIEVTPAQARELDFDAVIIQRPSELEGLVESWTGRVPGHDVPAIYLEHNAPEGAVNAMRHPAADRADLVVVHVTHFNDLFWDCGSTETFVIEHGIVDPGYRYTGELARAAVAINEARRRGRVTGTDLLPRFATAMPLDLFGMDAGALGGIDDPPQSVLHAEMPRRRAYLHPMRWTSLGLSLIEAMHLGMPVVAIASTDAVEAVPPGCGTVSTDVDRLCMALERYRVDVARRPRRRRTRSCLCSRALRIGAFFARVGRAFRRGDTMRIAMVSEHASPLATLGGVDAGGQNVHVAALACELGKLGNQVTVFTRRDAPQTAQRIPLAPNVVVEHVDAGPARKIAKDDIYAHVPAFAAYLERAFRRAEPDVVHSHFWMSGLAALRAAKPLAIPVVHTFHALGIEKRRHQGAGDSSPDARIAEERRIVRDADRIIATASAEVFELTRMGAPQDRLKIVPCGVDTGLFSPEGPRDVRRRDSMRIVALSRLVPRKGIDTVIEALPAVPDCELVIAGGGEGPDLVTDTEALRLSKLASALKVAGRVYMRGRVERAHVPELLRSADVVACTPWYEPFGIVPLEAMACGVPVIVSSVGGLVDTVVDGITGYHVPPRAPDRLAGALNALRVDPALRAAMGRAGRERVRSRYSWTRVAVETLDAYAAVCRTGKGEDSAHLATGA